MDGRSGLTQVPDEDLKMRLLDKVNNLNDAIFVQSLVPVLLYAVVLPVDTVRLLSGAGVLLFGLSLLAENDVGLEEE